MSIRVVIFGTSEFGIPSFEQLRVNQRFSIIGVVTQPAKPTGRHQTLTQTPVAMWAASYKLLTLTPVSLKNEAVQNQLRALAADIFIVAAYGLILPQNVLDIPKHGCLNIHASLLPTYRGASPISASILNGDAETGITFMQMDAGCDTGPMVKQISQPVTPKDTRVTLEAHLSALAAAHIVDIADQWCNGKVVAQPQPDQGVSLAPKISRQDGQARWDDADRLERQIRAYQPWPGLWTTWKSTELKILSAHVESTTNELPVGTVIEHATGWAIICERGLLVPESVQFSGKKAQPAVSIPGSYPGFIGSRIG